jgi:pilus assembly protein CpaB
MNRTRLLLIGFVAVSLGAFVSFTVYGRLKLQGGAGGQPGAPVLVATENLAVGTKVEDKDVKTLYVPQGDVPPGVLRRPERAVGRGVILPIYQGEFVLEPMLASANAGAGLPSLIPPGMRAVSVRVNEVVGVAGFVTPGTRVDILVTGAPPSGGDQQTTTVLRNVLVIAAGKNLERSTNGDAQAAAVITLLVSPDDAQKLTLASQQGRIQLALRNPLDTKQDELPGTSMSSLYRNGSAPPPAPVAPKRRVKKEATPAPAAPAPYTIEVYKGTKKEEKKFD